MAANLMPSDVSYLLIGRGRLAGHMQHYFSLLGIPYETWHRGMTLDELETKKSSATHILVLISDSAIQEFIKTHLTGVSAKVIHCSGSLVLPDTYGAHPLMTFGPEYYSVDIYKALAFVTDRSADVLPGLPNRIYSIPAEMKPRYHALCVMAANFSCLLWQKLFSDFEHKLDLPPDIAMLFMTQQIENLAHDYKTALTGPLARRDDTTIARNIDALAGDAFQDIYRAFVKMYKEQPPC